MRPDQERVRNLLTDTVTLLCKNGLQYQTELRVQGVLGITLDNNDVFIVHINEKFGGDIGGAISIRNDEGDAAKTLLGSRKSHDLNRSDAPGSINSKTVHKRRWQSRESSASPSLPANGSQPHVIQRPIKRLVPSKKELSPGDIGNRSAFFNSTGNDSVAHSSEEVVDVKVKTELDDVIILEDNQDNGSETSLNIPHMTDQTAMLDSYPDLASNEIQGSYGSFGEVLGATDISTDGAAPPAKRRTTAGSIHDSYSGSSEMGPTSDGKFVTGIIRNETASGDVAPQTTTATSWDQSHIPDFGSLSARDSQMILDSIPGCSTWDTSQQSTMRTPTSHSSLQNASDQSSESVGLHLLPSFVCLHVQKLEFHLINIWKKLHCNPSSPSKTLCVKYTVHIKYNNLHSQFHNFASSHELTLLLFKAKLLQN